MTVSPPTPIGEQAPPSLSDRDARLGELQFLIQSGRLRDWRQGVTITLARAGCGADLTVAEWAELPWFGPLEPWLKPGSSVTDVFLNGPEREVVIVEKGNRLPAGFALHREWIAFVQRQLLLHSAQVTPAQVADLNAMIWPASAITGTACERLRYFVTSPVYTPRGPTLALRIQPLRWRTLDDLVLEGIITRDGVHLLLEALNHGVSILVAGGTGSGKTTLTAALLQTIGEGKRAVVIEEAGELPELLDSVHVEVLRSGESFSACVRNALRQKPDLIVVGEARGPEALAMLQAAATGHPGIGTIHAPDVQAALKNLERMACEGDVPASVVRGMLTSSAVPLLIVHIDAQRYGGRRRVGRIEEVTPMGGGGAIGDKFTTNPLFVFDPAAGQLVQRGHVGLEWGRGRL